jgi:methanogenic corrinoid protein MtbC1
VIDGFQAAGLTHIKMAVGGAPISQMFAEEIGADGYGQNASAAVDLFLRLMADARKDGTLQDSPVAENSLSSQG